MAARLGGSPYPSPSALRCLATGLSALLPTAAGLPMCRLSTRTPTAAALAVLAAVGGPRHSRAVSDEDANDNAPWFRAPLPDEPAGWAAASLGKPWTPGRTAAVRDLRRLDPDFLRAVLEHYVPAAALLLRGPLAAALRAAGVGDPDETASDMVVIAAARYDPAASDRFGPFVVATVRRLARDLSRHAARGRDDPDPAARAAGWLDREVSAHLPHDLDADGADGPPSDDPWRPLREMQPAPARPWPTAGPGLAQAIPGFQADTGPGRRTVRLLASLSSMPAELADRLPDGPGLSAAAASLLLRLIHDAHSPDGPPGPKTGRRVLASRFIRLPDGRTARAAGSPLGAPHGLAGPGAASGRIDVQEAIVLGLVRLSHAEIPDCCLLCADPACDTIGHHVPPGPDDAWPDGLASRIRRATPVGVGAYARDAALARILSDPGS